MKTTQKLKLEVEKKNQEIAKLKRRKEVYLQA